MVLGTSDRSPGLQHNGNIHQDSFFAAEMVFSLSIKHNKRDFWKMELFSKTCKIQKNDRILMKSFFLPPDVSQVTWKIIQKCKNLKNKFLIKK